MKAILVLHQQHGYVRCVDVADYLGVSKPSVSRAVKELTKSGHIIKKDGTLYLTQQGRQYAEQICERYLFFTASRDDAYRNVVICSFGDDTLHLKFGGTLNLADITKIEELIDL